MTTGSDRTSDSGDGVREDHQPLDSEEAIFFRRLAVFAGTFDLAAAERVGGYEPLDRARSRALALALVDRSALDVDDDDRFSMRPAVKRGAATRLESAGETAETVARHTAYYAALVADGRRRYYRASGGAWIAAVRREAPDVEAAFERILHDPDDAVRAATMAGDLRVHWLLEGRARKAHTIASTLLGRLDRRREPALTAELYLIRSSRAVGAAALADLGQAIERYRMLGDGFGLVIAEGGVAEFHADAGDVAQARAAVVRLSALMRDQAAALRPYPRLAVMTHIRLGWISLMCDDPAGARAAFREAVAGAERATDAFLLHRAEIGLAEAVFADGDAARASEIARAVLPELRAEGDAYASAFLLSHLANYCLTLEDLTDATTFTSEALALGSHETRIGLSLVETSANILARLGSVAVAARLSGFLERRIATSSQQCPRYVEPMRDRLTGALERGLEPAEIVACAREGAAWSDAAATAAAREALLTLPSPRRRARDADTARERRGTHA